MSIDDTSQRPHLTDALPALGLALALIAALAIQWPGLSGPFVFDDFVNLSRLNSLHGEWSWPAIGRYLAEFPGTPNRPLATLSFLINDNAWPSDPESFKRTNVLLHALTGIVAFGFVRSLATTRLPRTPATWVALATTSAWLLHPIQLSTTMLVVQRMTILSALFSLAGLWMYLALIRRAETTQQALLAIAALGVATLLALLCKESGALTPLLALVVNITLFNNHLQGSNPHVRAVAHWGCIAPVVALFLALAWAAPSLLNYDTRDFTLSQRLMTEARVLIDYVRIIVTPQLGGSGLYHDDLVISRSLLQPATTLPAILTVLSAIAGGLMARHRYPLVAFSILWFAAGHILESSVFPLELYFEHRNYLPMLGVISSVCLAIASMHGKRTIFGCLFLAWLGLSTTVTHLQANAWGNEAMMATFWAKEKPESVRATQQYASYLERSGKPVSALEVFLGKLRAGNDAPEYPFQAILVACKYQLTVPDWLTNRAEEAAATGRYTHGVAGIISILREYAESKQCPTLVSGEYWWLLTDMLLKNPNYQGTPAPTHVRVERAYYQTNQRDLDATLHEYEIAYELRPSIELSQLIAGTLVSAGLLDEAKAWLERGLNAPRPLMNRLLSPAAAESKQLITIVNQSKSTTPSTDTPN